MDYLILCLLVCSISGIIGGPLPRASPKIYSRSEWNAKPPTSSKPLLENPAPFVVVHHSATPQCTTVNACKNRVQNIQTYHMDEKHFQDIGYNFLIGGDGYIFEGRGWNVHGAHAPTFNRRSIGVCLIGNYSNELPNKEQLASLQSLIEFGVRSSWIKDDYKLVGHRQGSATECPGLRLFNEIQGWPHFTPHPV